MTEQQIRGRLEKIFGNAYGPMPTEILEFCCELHGVDRRTRGQKAAERFVCAPTKAGFEGIRIGNATKYTTVLPYMGTPAGEVVKLRELVAHLVDSEIATVCTDKGEKIRETEDIGPDPAPDATL